MKSTKKIQREKKDILSAIEFIKEIISGITCKREIAIHERSISRYLECYDKLCIMEKEVI